MDRLRELLGDPPSGVAPVDWTSVTAQLGLELPADYRALFDVYPAMIIEDSRQYWTYTGSTTEFLVELFEGRLECPFYGPYDPGDRIEKITWF